MTDDMSKFENMLREKLMSDPETFLPEEVLKAMVHRAVEDLFFKKELLYRDYNGDHYGWTPVEKIIHRTMDERVKAACVAWLKENKGRVEAAVDSLIKEGVANMMLRAVTKAFERPLENLKEDLENQIDHLWEITNQGR